MTKRIVLCADDYGQAPAISRGIISLLEQERLSATSCLVTSPYWAEHAAWLKPYTQKADIGLHFNLTEGEGAFSLSSLMTRSLFRQLDIEAIEAALNVQIELFKNQMDCLPAYVDGHQHVLQFPVVRDAFLRVYDQLLKPEAVYVRLAKPQWQYTDFLNNFKKIAIFAMGANAFEALLGQHHIPHNTHFAGIYGFTGDFRTHFMGFLSELGDQGLVMCHPANHDEGLHGEARLEEFRYLSSSQFIHDCEAFKVKISRFSDTFNI